VFPIVKCKNPPLTAGYCKWVQEADYLNNLTQYRNLIEANYS
jgi:hypothetical protein